MKTTLTLTFDQFQDSIQGAGTQFGEDLLDAAKATVKAGGQVFIQVEDPDNTPHIHATFNTLQEIQDGWENTMRKLAEFYERLRSQLPQNNQQPPAS